MPHPSLSKTGVIRSDQIEKNAASTAQLCLDMDTNSSGVTAGTDWAGAIEIAVRAALSAAKQYGGQPAELYIEIVDNERSQQLNKEYRGKDKPTNVLSFPGTEPDDLAVAFDFSENGGPPVPLGDLIVAGTVLSEEAVEQNKSLLHHLMHLVVHGVLHLLGYDHIIEADAEIMETLEREILATLDVPNPYELPVGDAIDVGKAS
ncbi:MAG: rRNA maturation RNase YbeY [Kordiimonadaceae bacterium]|nr:rRNA maturation RNase YbeY [Kordiimonadaceae bacterium]